MWRCPSKHPEYTANADALSALRLLEAIRILGLQDWLYLGNLDARRDWGHARAMWRCRG